MSRCKPRPGTTPAPRAAFTLVELLVVIGIIAVLIGILLPSLSAARRSAQYVKCGASLQEIGLGYQMYSNEYKGWWPPGVYQPPTNAPYTIGDDTFQGVRIYWFNFIAPQVAAAKMGLATVGGSQAANSRTRNVLWGCPAFEGYKKYNIQAGDDTNSIQIGYGVNPFPLYDANLPNYDPVGSNYPPNETQSESNMQAFGGRWFKQSEYTHTAERCNIADARDWSAESLFVPPQATYPTGIVEQNQNAYAVTWTAAGQTLIDIYRHGRNPGLVNGNLAAEGGKVGYNILYCDGHVGQNSEAKTAYLSTRMRFPL